MNNNYHAESIRAQGVNVIPVQNKLPVIHNWGEWQHKLQPDILSVYDGDWHDIALIGGVGDVLIFDFDDKHYHDRTQSLIRIWYDRLLELYPNTPLVGFLEETPSGGWHLIVRVLGGHDVRNKSLWNVYEGGRRKYALIETRGHGGYAVIYPSQGYAKKKGDIENIPYISRELLDKYISAAISLDEPPAINTRNLLAQNNPNNNIDEQLRPGDRFNEEATVADMLSLLEYDGWKVYKETSDRIFLTRPGKDTGVSGDIHKGMKLFKAFTTSTYFESGRGYKPFSLLTMIKYNGDFKYAARELAKKYNLSDTPTGEKKTKQLLQKENKGIDDFYADDSLNNDELFLLTGNRDEEGEEKEIDIEANKFILGTALEEIDFRFHYITNHGEWKPLAAGGMIIPIKGGEKTRKSLFLHSIVGGALHGGIQYLGFKFELRGENILYFDTEQPMAWFLRDAYRIMGMADMKNHDKFHMYYLRDYNVHQRLKFIAKTVCATDKIAAIIIDGVVDICRNFNDIELSTYTVEFLMRLASYTGAIIFPVLHTTKTHDAMRGHLGSILAQKADGVFSISLIEDGHWSELKAYRFRAGIPFSSVRYTHGDGITTHIKGWNQYDEIT